TSFPKWTAWWWSEQVTVRLLSSWPPPSLWYTMWWRSSPTFQPARIDRRRAAPLPRPTWADASRPRRILSAPLLRPTWADASRPRRRERSMTMKLDARTQRRPAPGATTPGAAQLRSALVRAQTGSAFTPHGARDLVSASTCLSTPRGWARQAPPCPRSPPREQARHTRQQARDPRQQARHPRQLGARAVLPAAEAVGYRAAHEPYIEASRSAPQRDARPGRARRVERGHAGQRAAGQRPGAGLVPDEGR